MCEHILYNKYMFKLLILLTIAITKAQSPQLCEPDCVTILGSEKTCCYRTTPRCQACLVEDCGDSGRVNTGPQYCKEGCVYSHSGFHLLMPNGCVPGCVVSACNKVDTKILDTFLKWHLHHLYRFAGKTLSIALQYDFFYTFIFILQFRCLCTFNL